MARLGDLCKIQSGGTPSRSNISYWKNGTVPWVKISDIHGKYLNDVEEYITEEGLANSSAKIFPRGTILYTIFATLGDVCVLNIDAATNQAIAGIQITNDLVDADYLYYYLSSLKNKVNNMGRGVAQNNINMTMLRDFEIPLPSLDEQRKIAAVLDKISDLIAKRRRQLDKLDELVKSRFVEMFGDLRTNNKRLPIVSLKELGDWNSGGTPSRAKPEYFCGDIDWYSAGELNSLYLQGSVEKITQEALDDSAAKLFKQGSMLIGMYDTAAFKMGILRKASTSNQACACIEPNERVDVVWLYYTLLLMKDYFLQQRRGARQKNLNLGMLKSFEIPFADKAMQEQFVFYVERTDKMKSTIQRSLSTLETLKKSLMQEYFSMR